MENKSLQNLFEKFKVVSLGYNCFLRNFLKKY